MRKFTYTAKTGPKDIVNGTIEANDERDAVARILASGRVPVLVKPLIDSPAASAATLASDWKVVHARAPLADVAVMTRQMSDLLDAGLPILKALDLLSRQKQHPVIAPALVRMRRAIQEGSSLSAAMGQFPGIFSPIFVQMVRCGESGGNVSEVLVNLADFCDKDLEMRSKVKGALLYPGIIFCVGILTMAVMLTFILPRMTAMFEDMDTALPLPTQIVMAVSGFCAAYWWVILGVLAAIGYGLRRLWLDPAGRMAAERFFLTIPIVNEFLRDAETSRFSRTLGTLLQNGVIISAALESASAVVENTVFKADIKAAVQKVKAGSGVSQALKGSALFPELSLNLLAVGEEGGRLERGFFKLTVLCERRMNDTAQTFVTILGPAVLVGVVGVVGFMVIAMLLPMFKMNEMIQ
ncbi:MAG: type II secretion system F family protein [Candidatus Omnitrophica bacterium]|nr:type II secretion system F family protein [Candidatus Omnitrophota bacterium]